MLFLVTMVWRTLEMPLINCEISLQLTWSKNCFLVAGTAGNQNPTFPVNDTKLYVPAATLSTQGDIKLLKHLVNLVLKEQIIGINI